MTAAPRIEFFEDGHRYVVDGRELPSVTKVLKRLADGYECVDPDVLERASLLGQAVHKLIELDVRRVLDEDALDDALRPYLAQWREFIATSGFVPLLSEERVASLRYGYAGMLDLFGTLNGDAALIDAKRTALVPRKAGPQTAGYEIALRESHPDIVKRATRDGPLLRRFALHLTPERWQLVPFRNQNDSRVFLSALTQHQWENQQ